MSARPEYIEICAAWWHRQWGAQMGFSLEGAVSAIESLTVSNDRQAALIGMIDGKPAGSVFLVNEDLESHRHLQPWLAGLLVQPAFRGLGLGHRLANALTAEAARLGHQRIYLYTSVGDFYRAIGWHSVEAVFVHGVPHEIMSIAPSPLSGKVP